MDTSSQLRQAINKQLLWLLRNSKRLKEEKLAITVNYQFIHNICYILPPKQSKQLLNSFDILNFAQLWSIKSTQIASQSQRKTENQQLIVCDRSSNHSVKSVLLRFGLMISMRSTTQKSTSIRLTICSVHNILTKQDGYFKHTQRLSTYIPALFHMLICFFFENSDLQVMIPCGVN